MSKQDLLQLGIRKSSVRQQFAPNRLRRASKHYEQRSNLILAISRSYGVRISSPIPSFIKAR